MWKNTHIIPKIRRSAFLMCYHCSSYTRDIGVSPHKHSWHFRFSLKKLLAKSSFGFWFLKAEFLGVKGLGPHLESDLGALTPGKELACWGSPGFVSREWYALSPSSLKSWSHFCFCILLCQVLTHPLVLLFPAPLTVSHFFPAILLLSF